MTTYDRRAGLGSSDAAPALGLSPWRSPLELWLEKTGQREPDQADTPAMYWGRVLEDVVADEYARRTGTKLRRRSPMTSRDWPWMRASLDRTVDGDRTIVECKTTGWQGEEWGEPGTDEIPAHYLAQCYHQLAVARGYLTVRVPVLFLAERRLEIYEVARDDRLIGQLVEREREFWRRVEERDPEGLATTPADIRALYPRDDGSDVVTTPEVFDALAALATVKAEQKDAASRREALEAIVQRHMGQHAYLVDEHGRALATWKTSMSRVVDNKALAAEHPEIVERYRVERTSRRFLPKVKIEETTDV